jgi:hypothetical protein
MRKNIIHIIITLVILVVGPNVYADGTDGDKDKKSKKEKSEKIVDRISSTFDLELENWMISAEEFSSASEYYESELRMESWMTETFEMEALEAELEMEEWMVTPFETKDNFQEEELALEDWMLKF